MSKVHQVCKLIDGIHCMGDIDSLREYHSAKLAVNACRCRDPFRKLATVKHALKNYRVVVTLGPVGDVLIRDFATGKSAVV